MIRKGLSIFVIVLCLGVILSGCAQKGVVKEESSAKGGGELQAGKDADKIKEEDLKKDFEKSLVAKRTPGIEGEVHESKMLKDIHFDFDRYNIRPEDAQLLKDNSALLKSNPKMKFQIEGHCDERGTGEYNLALGERRANSVKKYLVSLGIASSRILTISYGEERPLDPGHSEEAWAKNRRALFIVLNK